MSNIFDEMRNAVAEARNTLSAADNISNSMACLLEGRMRKVWNKEALCAIKKELRDYNIHTREWKK